ncbi:MAG: DNA-binding protein [Nitrospirae bacterium]|nr:MAG: DNA-binding protein [Nitrospirota bacterium]
MSDSLMTVKDALEHLKIGRTKFYSLIGEGKIRTVKIGKRTLLDPLDLKQFVEKQKTNFIKGKRRKS